MKNIYVQNTYSLSENLKPKHSIYIECTYKPTFATFTFEPTLQICLPWFLPSMLTNLEILHHINNQVTQRLISNHITIKKHDL